MTGSYEQIPLMPEKQPKNMNAFLLQIKGDTSFSLFSQVTDVESLSETWKLCSKVAGHLEQGKRLENLSWRLFHLHSTMTAESVHDRSRTFERISKETGKKLDRERHLGLSQLPAPPLKSCRRMNQPMTGVSATIHHPTLLCSLSSPADNGTGGLVNCTAITSSTHISFSPSHAWDFDFKTGSINFESLISSFSPLALLGAVDHYPQLQENCNILENQGNKMGDSTTAIWNSVNYPPFDIQPDEPMYLKNRVTKDHCNNKFEPAPAQKVENVTHQVQSNPSSGVLTEPFIFDDWNTPSRESPESQFMASISIPNDQLSFQNPPFEKNSQEELQSTEMNFNAIISEENQDIRRQANTVTEYNMNTTTFKSQVQTNSNSNKKERVGEKRKRRNPMATRLPKFVGVSAILERAPGDNLSEKSVCFNCRGTHTPLWRRGPNDEILCNACGVFYNVHKKNRPPNLSKCNYAGNLNSNVNSQPNGQGTRIECTNCNAKATPMWRKAPDGSLLCNACALYFKCHKRSRPATCSKTSISQQPLGVVNQLSNFHSYSNDQNGSLGIKTPSNNNFEFYNNDSDVSSGAEAGGLLKKNHLIDSFEYKEFDARNLCFNELNLHHHHHHVNEEFDFFKSYPTCFYTSPQ